MNLAPAQWLLVPLSGKSVDELYEVWDGQKIRNWERMSLQIMLYSNIVRPFAYFFQTKNRAVRITEFAKKFGELADVSEGEFETSKHPLVCFLRKLFNPRLLFESC